MASECLAEKALEILKEKSEKARTFVRQTILEEKTGIKKVDEAVEQYLLRWDDTTRPAMLSLACEAVGGNSEDALPLQIALHFIDATLDIHDDIIDESVTKKNRKTIYGRLGKEAALLIGNAFMVKGFNQLYKVLENLPEDRRLPVIDCVKAFLLEVVNAHISEAGLKDKKWKVNPEEYLQVLTMKAADIEGRMRIGAIYGGGSAREIEALSKYGRNLGVLLAVRAEFADMFEPSELMHRIKYECLPLPILYAFRSRKHGKRIREILKRDCFGKEDCNELIGFVYDTKEVALLKQQLYDLKNKALSTLTLFSNSQMKCELELLTDSMIEDL